MKSSSNGSNHFSNGKVSANQSHVDEITSFLQRQWVDGKVIRDAFHISERTLHTWRKEGLMPYCKMLGTLFYKVSDVLEAFEKNRVNVETKKEK